MIKEVQLLNGNNFPYLKNLTTFAPRIADVAELVDALDLGSSALRRGGSSPFVRTKHRRLSFPESTGGDLLIGDRIKQFSL